MTANHNVSLKIAKLDICDLLIGTERAVFAPEIRLGSAEARQRALGHMFGNPHASAHEAIPEA